MLFFLLFIGSLTLACLIAGLPLPRDELSHLTTLHNTASAVRMRIQNGGAKLSTIYFTWIDGMPSWGWIFVMYRLSGPLDKDNKKHHSDVNNFGVTSMRWVQFNANVVYDEVPSLK